MLNFFRGLVVIGAAVTIGSGLLFPLTILALGLAVAKSIQWFWPWLIAIAIYGLILALIVKGIKSIGWQKVVALCGAALPTVLLWWGASSVDLVTASWLILVAFVSFAAGSSTCSDVHFRNKGRMAGLAAMVIAPLSMVFYTYSHDIGMTIYFVIAVPVAILAAAKIADGA